MNASITSELLQAKLNDIAEAIEFFERQSNSNLEYWTTRYDSEDDADKLRIKQSWHRTEQRKIETLRFAHRLLSAAISTDN